MSSKDTTKFGVFLVQIVLTIVIFLISQPIFFEMLRDKDPEENLTLGILVLGILIAAGAGIIVFIVVYRGEGKKIRDVILAALSLTIVSFMFISYARIFIDGVWLAPWYQILTLAVYQPSYFWLAWAIIFSLFCSLFSAMINLRSEVFA